MSAKSATMLGAFHVFSEQVVGDSYLEFLGLAVLISAVVTGYRHLECHHSGCHRLGRFRHGHLKLCAVHHPLVPNNGRICDKEIKEVSAVNEAARVAALRPGTPAQDRAEPPQA